MMKLNSKILLPLLIVYGLILSASSLAQQTSTSDLTYFAVAYTDCDEIKRIELTSEQIKLWHSIQNIEVDMLAIHEPMKYLEERAERLGEDIEYFTQEAFSWEDGKLSVDLQAISEQTEMAMEISHLIASHAEEFSQLDTLGYQISALVETFRFTLNESFGDTEYEHINIYKDGEKSKHEHCPTDARIM